MYFFRWWAIVTASKDGRRTAENDCRNFHRASTFPIKWQRNDNHCSTMSRVLWREWRCKCNNEQQAINLFFIACKLPTHWCHQIYCMLVITSLPIDQMFRFLFIVFIAHTEHSRLWFFFFF
jgi:hypothetical protein